MNSSDMPRIILAASIGIFVTAISIDIIGRRINERKAITLRAKMLTKIIEQGDVTAEDLDDAIEEAALLPMKGSSSK